MQYVYLIRSSCKNYINLFYFSFIACSEAIEGCFTCTSFANCTSCEEGRTLSEDKSVCGGKMVSFLNFNIKILNISPRDYGFLSNLSTDFRS